MPQEKNLKEILYIHLLLLNTLAAHCMLCTCRTCMLYTCGCLVAIGHVSSVRGIDHVPDYQTCVHDGSTVSLAFSTAVMVAFKVSLAFKQEHLLLT